ncbi:MAG TPA: DUF4870 domain-containing protein [Edaphobacter sp.]
MSDFPQDPVPPQTPPPPPYIPPAPATPSGLADNVAAALAYITVIPAIIFLVLEPSNKIPLVRFHSFQSIGLCIVSLLLSIVLRIGQEMLHIIPLTGLLFGLISMVLALALFIAWLIAILKAFKGEWYKLPFIGDIAERQARS